MWQRFACAEEDWVRGAQSKCNDKFVPQTEDVNLGKVCGSAKYSPEHKSVVGHKIALRVFSLGFRFAGLGFRVSGFGFRVQGSGFREFRVQGFGLRA